MTLRVAIGNSLRFKVFKRDLFVCQYCGATPPSVILEVDHIHPVSKGGKNGIDNLITACFSCNRGKAGTPLSEIPKSLADKAIEIAEREAQLKGYSKILQAKEKRVYREMWDIAAAIEGVERLDDYSSRDLQSIRRFLQDLPAIQIIEAARIARSRFPYRSSKTFKYFCGICWKMIRSEDGAEG